MASRVRADVALVERGFFESRARARAAIEAGLVTADGVHIGKPSEALLPDARVDASAPHPWVSRGGVKLAHALDHFGFDPAGRLCLDIGSSTGGFTQVLLARGAALVIAVDVGYGQLRPSLANDPRVMSLEKTDARALTRETIERAARDADLDAARTMLITCDVSFIGLDKVLPSALTLATPRSELVALIKPQFEAGDSRRKGGVVKDAALHQQVCKNVAQTVTSLGFDVLGIEASPIFGGDGNREFLIGARRA
ncbi:MAG: rRNA (cytidine1920-2-O)/16S rRNA (cytidine1409-2-O)-methyltransferase [Methylobacteriaceae bacterium]|jgi:23S rRNA (cytidine1920-2'-O)/16S rRNA (cytidine1409-2'-O)-methyltransferase|nr:rRNA (cytidine1920-2-O)/16S rRNA (cytidine1409-2-O)-methyltransferase [Methylobacteriaceae bacterium]